jgi:hypothetical protein
MDPRLDAIKNVLGANLSSDMGGIRRFQAGFDEIVALRDSGYLDMDESQSETCPSCSKFLELAIGVPDFIFVGYVVDSSREDARITVEEVLVPTYAMYANSYLSGCEPDEKSTEGDLVRYWWD